MPIRYKISPDGLFVHTLVEGAVSNADLYEYSNLLMNDPDLKPRYRELFDATRVTKIGVDKKGIEQLSELDQQYHHKVSGSKCAIIVSDSKAFSLAEYFEELAREHFIDVIVFNSVTTARTWLGVGEDAVI